VGFATIITIITIIAKTESVHFPERDLASIKTGPPTGGLLLRDLPAANSGHSATRGEAAGGGRPQGRVLI
jgi:hypothetical protein